MAVNFSIVFFNTILESWESIIYKQRNMGKKDVTLSIQMIPIFTLNYKRQNAVVVHIGGEQGIVPKFLTASWYFNQGKSDD